MIGNINSPASYRQATTVAAGVVTAASVRQAGVNTVYAASAGLLTAAALWLMGNYAKPSVSDTVQQVSGHDLSGDEINTIISYIPYPPQHEDLNTLNSIGGAGGILTKALSYYLNHIVDPRDHEIAISFANFEGLKSETRQALNEHMRNNLIPHLPHEFNPSHTVLNLGSLNNSGGLEPETRQALNMHIRDNVLPRLAPATSPTGTVMAQMNIISQLENLELETQQVLIAHMRDIVIPHLGLNDIHFFSGILDPVRGWGTEPQDALNAHIRDNILPQLGPNHRHVIDRILNKLPGLEPETRQALDRLGAVIMLPAQ
jgi:hypothetical protein